MLNGRLLVEDGFTFEACLAALKTSEAYGYIHPRANIVWHQPFPQINLKP